MAARRPFRFGTMAMQIPSRHAWIAYARKVEALGYSTLVMGEHPSSGGAAPLLALLAAAAATTRLRVATHVLVNDFRNPVLLAQEVATLDWLSEGRLEFGIGAGWRAADYAATGISFEPAATRVRRLEEAVPLLKQLWGDDVVTFAGDFYAVSNMHLQTTPYQRPYPPLYIGGGGKHVLSLAAREADIIGVSSTATAAGALDLATRTPRAFDQKVAWIREAAGERFGELELNTLIQQVLVTDHRRQGAAETLRWYASASAGMLANVPRSIEEVLDAPYCLIGTVEQIVEQLQERRERYGISYITVYGGATETLGPVIERLSGA